MGTRSSGAQGPQQPPVRGDGFSAGLTHSQRTHDRAEEQHVSRQNVSAEAFIMSNTHSKLRTQCRDEEIGAEILLCIHLKTLAATS